MKRRIESKTIYAVTVFYIVAVTVRYFAVKTNILEGTNLYVKIIAEGLGPTLGVIIASLIFKIKFRPMTLKGNYRSWLFPSLTYWIIPIFAIPAYTLFTKNEFPVLFVFMVFIYGLLEETGWRGFLQQQLKGLPKILNIIIVGILWFVWHLNFNMSIENLLFFGLLIFGTWGLGELANATNSLLVVAAFHSLNNVKSQNNLIFILLLFAIWIVVTVYVEKRKKRKIRQAVENIEVK
ncbi:MAG: CPBP family intramembrane metalloprotease [Prevotellaceae bacterium]|jgi:membrane protease YdiL (CAAX protease family)|nr:CPBP family intramembrane metalloprotease [Prevotellaceae bacterium]